MFQSVSEQRKPSKYPPKVQTDNLHFLRDKRGQVAQLVEQRTENPRVGGSIPSLATIETEQ